MKRFKVKKVSLSGKTRLTYREAVALIDCAYAGYEDIIDGGEQTEEWERCFESMINKLKEAIGIAGGYPEELGGSLYNPFDCRLQAKVGA